MTQMTPAEMRADAERRLGPLGKKRARLLRELEAVDAELRPEIRRAREVEVPIRRISEIASVAPNTVRAWLKSKPEGGS